MLRPNDKQRVLDHYNRASPYYRARWGEHLHHGYWIRGDESKEIAPLQLVELNTMLDYETWLAAAGLHVKQSEILNRHTAQTWGFCLDIIKHKSLWQLAARHGSEFLRFRPLRLRSHRREPPRLTVTLARGV
jgi:hypothetical protein